MSVEVARTILRQLGGTRFLAMTGAKNLAGDDDALYFNLSSSMTWRRGSRMCIRLGDDDLYTLELFRVSDFEPQVVDTRRHVHVEDLRRTFTDMTGLDTSLGDAA